MPVSCMACSLHNVVQAEPAKLHSSSLLAAACICLCAVQRAVLCQSSQGQAASNTQQDSMHNVVYSACT